ncbi:hypothetical protein LINGRAHAP2_LOCUS34703 [Linum grandiflorum]
MDSGETLNLIERVESESPGIKRYVRKILAFGSSSGGQAHFKGTKIGARLEREELGSRVLIWLQVVSSWRDSEMEEKSKCVASASGGIAGAAVVVVVVVVAGGGGIGESQLNKLLLLCAKEEGIGVADVNIIRTREERRKGEEGD